jgi:hypothetical protein
LLRILRFIDPFALDPPTPRGGGWSDWVIDKTMEWIADRGEDFVKKTVPGRAGICSLKYDKCISDEPTIPEDRYREHCNDCEAERQKCVNEGPDDEEDDPPGVHDAIDRYNGRRSIRDVSHSRGPKVPNRPR